MERDRAYIREQLKQFILALLLVVLPGLLLNLLRTHLVTTLGFPTLWEQLSYLPLTLIIHLLYHRHVTRVEQRPVSELYNRQAAKDFVAGGIVAGLAFLLVMACAFTAGVYEVTGIGSPTNLIENLGFLIYVVYFEEIGYRAVVFRYTEEISTTFRAALVSSFFFMVGHADNPGATVLSNLSIFLFGMIFAYLYIRTRRLWFVLSAHFFWNYTQGNIFGVTVSGYEFSGIVVGRLDGSELLSGGGFGIEASIITIGLAILACVYLVRTHHSKLEPTS